MGKQRPFSGEAWGRSGSWVWPAPSHGWAGGSVQAPLPGSSLSGFCPALSPGSPRPKAGNVRSLLLAQTHQEPQGRPLLYLALPSGTSPLNHFLSGAQSAASQVFQRRLPGKLPDVKQNPAVLRGRPLPGSRRRSPANLESWILVHIRPGAPGLSLVSGQVLELLVLVG